MAAYSCINQIFYILFFSLLTISGTTNATHLRAGYIHVSNDPYSLHTVIVTIVIYTDTDSAVPFGGGTLAFGDGNDVQVSDENAISTLHDYPVGTSTYTTRHTYSGLGKYKISYNESNRNAGIHNIKNSIQTTFYLETVIHLDPAIGNLDTSHPLLPLYNIFHNEENNFLSLTMRRVDEEIYTYFLAVPLSAPEVPVQYVWVENANIGTTTGLFQWDLTKEDPQFNFTNIDPSGAEFVFAVRANQYKKINDQYVRTSQTLIDFQILVKPSEGGIIITGDTTNQVVKSNEKVIVKRYFSSNEVPGIEISTDLPQENFSLKIDSTSAASDNQAIVTMEVVNNNLLNGPYSFSIRGQTTSGSKDDVVVIHFNEQQEYPLSIITSIEEENDAYYIIYPNPSDGRIKLMMNEDKNCFIRIYRPSGKLILEKSINNEDQLYIQQPGVYFYIISGGHTLIKSGKLVVK